jgi:hypothetical protein
VAGARPLTPGAEPMSGVTIWDDPNGSNDPNVSTRRTPASAAGHPPAANRANNLIAVREGRRQLPQLRVVHERTHHTQCVTATMKGRPEGRPLPMWGPGPT